MHLSVLRILNIVPVVKPELYKQDKATFCLAEASM